MAEFRALCRLASSSSVEEVRRLLAKRAKAEGVKLEEASAGSLFSFCISKGEVMESVSTDGTFLAVEVHSSYPLAFSATIRPSVLSWLLDADIIPGTEKPFPYHDKEAYGLTEDNLPDVIAYLDGDKTAFLPIVYLPYGCIQDVPALQDALRGQAHVIAESGATMRLVLKDRFLVDCPADYTVRIFYPSGNTQDIDLTSFLSQSERLNVIAYAVASSMALDERLPFLSWEFICDGEEDEEPDGNEVPKVEDAASPSIEISDDKEDLVSMIHSLMDELDLERQAKHKAQLDARRWKSLYESRPREGRISLECSEKDLYLEECRDALLHLVDSRIREIESGERDPGKLRYYHILKSIQESNSKAGEGDKLRKDIEEALLEDSITILRANLEKLGFDDVTATGHLRFSFCHDERYTLVLACTPSDRAARRNAGSSKVMKSFFPF